MVAFRNPFKKKHTALKPEQVAENLRQLEAAFGDLWDPDKIKKFYEDLMQAMGTDFTVPATPTEEYKKNIIKFEEGIKSFQYDEKNKLGIFEIENGYITANHNQVAYQGDTFDAAAADKMAFIAVHDKDMIEQGVTLDGANLYQKTLLQLSIQYNDPEGKITIHNKIEETALDQKALQDFRVYIASKHDNQPSNGPTIQPNDTEAEETEEEKPEFSLSDDQYEAVKKDVIEAGEGSKTVLYDSLARNGVKSTDIKEAIKDARTRLKAENFIDVTPNSKGERLKVNPAKAITNIPNVSELQYKKILGDVLRAGEKDLSLKTLADYAEAAGVQGRKSDAASRIAKRMDFEGITTSRPGRARSIREDLLKRFSSAATDLDETDIPVRERTRTPPRSRNRDEGPSRSL